MLIGNVFDRTDNRNKEWILNIGNDQTEHLGPLGA